MWKVHRKHHHLKGLPFHPWVVSQRPSHAGPSCTRDLHSWETLLSRSLNSSHVPDCPAQLDQFTEHGLPREPREVPRFRRASAHTASAPPWSSIDSFSSHRFPISGLPASIMNDDLCDAMTPSIIGISDIGRSAQTVNHEVKDGTASRLQAISFHYKVLVDALEWFGVAPCPNSQSFRD